MNRVTRGVAVMVAVCGLAVARSGGQVPAETTPHVMNPNVKVDGSLRFEYADLDALLDANVVQGRIDYLAIRRDWMPMLAGYLDRVAEFDPDTLGPKEKLALYINLYNATMIKVITDRLTVDYTCAENNKSIFNEPLVRVGKRTISLNYLEHKLIRATFQDPRIHGALVCGGMGCPPMANFAFRGDILDKQLDERMAVWAKDNTRNVVDEKAKTVKLSKLFKSYAADFGGEEQAIATVAKYRGMRFDGYKVEFDTNYDWSLNMLPPRYGKWVVLTEGGGAEGQIYEVVSSAGEKVYVKNGQDQHFLVEAAKTRPLGG